MEPISSPPLPSVLRVHLIYNTCFLIYLYTPRIKSITLFVERFPLRYLPKFHLSRSSLGRIILPIVYILLLLYAFILVDFRFGEYARFYMRDNQIILSSLIRISGLFAAIVLSKSRLGFPFIILYVVGELALGRRFTSALLLTYLISVYFLPRANEFFRIFSSLRLSKSFLIINFVVIFSFFGLISTRCFALPLQVLILLVLLWSQ